MVRQIEKHTVIWFLGAQTISLFGSLIVQFAVVWYVTLVTESATMLAVSAISGFLPQLAVSVFAGVWIDRYPRKKVIVAADMLTAAATAGLAWQFYLGRESMPVIFAVLVIRALATGVQMPAVNAMLPQLADKNKLMKVNGINAALNSGMMLLAPLAGGMLLNYLSFTAVLLTDIVTAVAGVAILLFIKVRPVVKEEQKSSRMKSFGQKMKDGYAFLRKDIFMRRLLLFQFVVLFLISPSAFLNPLLVSTKFGGDVRLLSGAEAVYSLGMVIGGMAAAGLGKRVAKIYLMFAAAAFYGFFMAASVEPSAADYNQLSINPTLQCKQKNDRFTVNDEKVGNGALTYPVSLITVDEIYLAGGSTMFPNNGYYLYNGDYYWALSPYLFNGSSAYVRLVVGDGDTSRYNVTFSHGVRPVLNLKAGSLKMGSGTATDPYTV